MPAKIALPLMEDKRPIRNRSRRRLRPVLMLFLGAITIYGLYTYAAGLSTFIKEDNVPPNLRPADTPEAAIPEAAIPEPVAEYEGQNATPSVSARGLVPLEAHIISKCPDTRDCLKELVLPAMIRASDKVNFTLTYIGTPTENDGVECKHGPAECIGNIIELCAHHLYPDPKIWLGFTMCLTKDYKAIPQRELVEDCALEHALDFDALNECATSDNGAFGMAMLRDSVERSTSRRAARSA
ncbi:hypothetical protein F4808DRAFT_461044 [Astrocystis sublimbata]|nr:hypothetical protein F4808DRAFT_461044 [Astrocystis sublimbata]